MKLFDLQHGLILHIEYCRRCRTGKQKQKLIYEARGLSRGKRNFVTTSNLIPDIVGRKFAAQPRQLIFSSCKSNLVGCAGMSDRFIQALCNRRVGEVRHPEVHLSECKNKVFANEDCVDGVCKS